MENITLNNLADKNGARYKSKRIGRGLGSGKGKTAGKGYKGQKARAGIAIKGFEGGQMPIHRRLPKRGFKSLHKAYKKTIQIVTIADIIKLVENVNQTEGLIVNKDFLQHNNIIKCASKPVKLLASNEKLVKSIMIELDFCSISAKKIIEESGSKIKLIGQHSDEI